MQTNEEYGSMPLNLLLATLQTSAQGISTDEAQKRFAIYGPNEVTMRRTDAWTIFLRQFKSPFNYLLLTAACISFFIGEFWNGLLIGFLAFFNLCIGFWQEYRAHKALEELKSYIPDLVKCVRDGIPAIIKRADLVPGDCIILEAHTIVAADARLIDNGYLLVDESILTGESVPLEKRSEPTATVAAAQSTCMLFAGSVVQSGYAKAIVVATGDTTAFAGIAGIQEPITRLSAYERSIIRLSSLLIRSIIITVIGLFCVKLVLNQQTSFVESLLFFMTLIVTIVPEALQTVVIVALSQAALSLARHQVVVKRLGAIDDLGDIQVLCVDKTGTMTEPSLAIDEIVASNPDLCLEYALINAHAFADGASGNNSFDDMLVQTASEAMRARLADVTIIGAQPFDGQRLYSAVLAKKPDSEQYIYSMKGTAEALLPLITTTSQAFDKHTIEEQIRTYGEQGKRISCLVYALIPPTQTMPEPETLPLVYGGFLVFNNPIKYDAKKTLDRARSLGIKIKMISGDTLEVSRYVAQKIGLISRPDQCITGNNLAVDNTEHFATQCKKYTVFARISPAIKARIVASLENNYRVGFLGDGINDIPALRVAHVAIVVQQAPDMARASADIIMLRHDLKVLIAGIRYGRVTFVNINKFIIGTLVGNFAGYYSLILFSLILPFLPALPAQMLLNNFLADIPLIALASDTVDANTLNRPRTYNLAYIVPLIIILACVGTSCDYIFFILYRKESAILFRSLWFLFNCFSQLVLIFSIRTTNFFLHTVMPSKTLLVTSAVSILLTLAAVHSTYGQRWFSFVPPTPQQYWVIIMLTAFYLALTEIIKIQYHTFMLRKAKGKNKQQ